MEKKKIKILLGLFYLVILSTFLYFLFSNVSYQDIKSIKILQTNIDHLNLIKENNLVVLIFGFFIFTIVWVFFLGFGTPIALVGGFIFGKWIGTFLVTISLTVGATSLYLVGIYFFYDFLKKKLFLKFQNFHYMFKTNQLSVMIIFRFVGFVPFFLANLLPVIFNIRLKNYFFGTLIGILPSIFILVSLGAGLSKAIYHFDTFPSFFDLISLPEIYFPILGFFVLLIITFVYKKFFFKENELH